MTSNLKDTYDLVKKAGYPTAGTIIIFEIAPFQLECNGEADSKYWLELVNYIRYLWDHPWKVNEEEGICWMEPAKGYGHSISKYFINMNYREFNLTENCLTLQVCKEDDNEILVLGINKENPYKIYLL